MQTLAEGLLTFFVGKGDKESFAATLYTCYTLIRADVAMELAWRHRLYDYVMPFMIQYIRDTNSRLHKLEERTKSHAEKAHGGHGHADGEIDPHSQAMHGFVGPTGMLAIADTPFNAAPMPQMGGMLPPTAMVPPSMGGGMPPPTMGGMGMMPPPTMGFGGYGSATPF